MKRALAGSLAVILLSAALLTGALLTRIARSRQLRLPAAAAQVIQDLRIRMAPETRPDGSADVVPLPDIRGREQILKVHMRKVPVAPDIDASILARGCPGFSGADLANLVNEAALFAARGNKRQVDMEDFERAKDKIMMGATAGNK